MIRDQAKPAPAASSVAGAPGTPGSGNSFVNHLAIPESVRAAIAHVQRMSSGQLECLTLV
jgi:hypothetical protein